jgi:HPt (histidine-containing phosphotransfer) domain-containing protein
VTTRNNAADDAGDPTGDIRVRLAEIGGGHPTGPERQLLARLLTSFTTKTPSAVELLYELLHGGDVTAVQHHAHALKGSASNLGITTLARMFAEIENQARAGRLPEPDTTMTAIRQQYALVQPACTAIAHDLNGPARE